MSITGAESASKRIRCWSAKSGPLGALERDMMGSSKKLLVLAQGVEP